MALIVLDASVVVAYLDGDDAHHAAAVVALQEHADDDLRLPASAYAEALVLPARRGLIDAVRAEVEALLLQIEPLDARIAEGAASLRAAHATLRLPDALVLACGDTLAADAVLTADRSWRRFPRVRMIG